MGRRSRHTGEGPDRIDKVIRLVTPFDPQVYSCTPQPVGGNATRTLRENVNMSLNREAWGLVGEESQGWRQTRTQS